MPKHLSWGFYIDLVAMLWLIGCGIYLWHYPNPRAPGLCFFGAALSCFRILRRER